MNLQELIAAQRAKLAAATPTEFDIVLGGEKLTVAINRMRPDQWAELTGAHPPRTGTVDTGVGYNQATLPRDYPVELITIGGANPEQPEWQAAYEVLDPVHRVTIGNVIWGVNVFTGLKEFQALGKAAAGDSSDSPANTGYPRSDSADGNRPK